MKTKGSTEWARLRPLSFTKVSQVLGFFICIQGALFVGKGFICPDIIFPVISIRLDIGE